VELEEMVVEEQDQDLELQQQVQLTQVEVEVEVVDSGLYTGASGGSGIVIVRAPGSAGLAASTRYKHSYNITRTSWWL
jgi:hypothetical protein